MALLAPACAIIPDHLDHPAPVVRGPIPARTQQAIKLTFLTFRPRRAATQPQGKTLVSVQSAYSSVYQNGHSANDDVVFDGEISHTALSLRHALSPSTDIEIELACTYASGGFLDAFVENYHEVLGLPDEGRDNRPRDAYEMEVSHDGVEAYEMEGNELGFADLPIILTQELHRETATTPGIAVRAGIELPTGSESKGFGNGEIDCGGGILGEKSFGRWTATGAVDYVVTGSSDSFEDAEIDAKDNLDLQLGLEYRWNDRLSLLLGAVLESPVTQDVTIKELDGEILSIDLGAAWDIGEGSRFLIEFGEDAVARSGPDFTLMAAWSSSL